ncbi:GtrA family protein [Natrialba magadii ATCC 43099]|uniref:GtrA family protein n=1 Tax=Natrialba magadii (strain ATCC 43099 / DSM 3394 / CCM 3739 / CIP 104546 / IAM 13178 / JCM 8861 / NBRC 102185 / NCIMB 2190 / MS3) TaxID=547559 RepID=D3SY87_NATMM|nr:GtrA family protein [Natrialba magadii]ADD06058.1 GtrA family protein [Natrialba magadii ATCC 43099]ELY30945.1 GtrA family protein [Natrialba magadii ATCC 43099]
MTDSLIDAIRTRVHALLSTSRFSQFASVGLVGATVDNAGLITLVELTGLDPVIAKVISWELSIIVIFLLNEYWTFAGHGKRSVSAFGRRFLRSNAVRFGGFLVTLTVLAVLVNWYDVNYVLANVIGIGIGFFVNYTCESLYTWKVHRDGR